MWRIRPRLFLGDYRSGLHALSGATAVDELAAWEAPGLPPAPASPLSPAGAAPTADVLDTLRSALDDDGDRGTLPSSPLRVVVASAAPGRGVGVAAGAPGESAVAPPGSVDADAEVLSTLKSAAAAAVADPRVRPFAGVVSLCEVPLHPDDGDVSPVDAFTEWLQLPFADGAEGAAELEGAVRAARVFIDRQRRRGNVLVHCAAGMSRSVTVVAAWLCEEGEAPSAALRSIALAKAEALGVAVEMADSLVAPAPEFRRFLDRYQGG